MNTNLNIKQTPVKERENDNQLFFISHLKVSSFLTCNIQKKNSSSIHVNVI